MSAATHHSITLPAPVTGRQDTSTFYFEDHAIRVAHQDGKPWFVATDVCTALKLTNPSAAVAALDADERSKLNLDRRAGEVLVVSESGLYTLILLNRGAVIEGTVSHRFRRWVTGEVLPAIRETGSYVPAPAPLAIDVRNPAQLQVIALQLLQVSQEQAREICVLRSDLAAAETRVELDRPKVAAYEAFLDDEGLCNLRSAARAVDAPTEAFFEWLKKRGWIVKEGGWLQPGWERRRDKHFLVRMRPADGKLRPQTFVSRGGLVWLRDRWLAKQRIDAADAERARRQGVLGL